MAFTVAWEEKGVVVTLSGELDIDEVDRAGEVLYTDQRFRHCKYQIFDFLATDISAISLEDIGNMATKDVLASVTIHNPSIALVTNSPINTVLMEHYINVSKQLGIQWHARSFDTRKEAEKWCKEVSENT